jgi:hypothetical protein
MKRVVWGMIAGTGGKVNQWKNVRVTGHRQRDTEGKKGGHIDNDEGEFGRTI